MFGAQVNLNISGKNSENTALGGMVTIALKLLILSYLCIRVMAVIDNTDPSISSY